MRVLYFMLGAKGVMGGEGERFIGDWLIGGWDGEGERVLGSGFWVRGERGAVRT